jgi:hypothetical protein
MDDPVDQVGFKTAPFAYTVARSEKAVPGGLRSVTGLSDGV